MRCRCGLLFLVPVLAVLACGPSILSSPSPSPEGSPRPDRSILFATKSGRAVTLQRFDLDTHLTTTVHTYEEEVEAEHSRNWWQERPPSIARTADGGTIAFAADDGLHTLDLRTGTRRTLVAKTVQGKQEEPSSWSPSLGDHAHGIFSPAWSHDARFLSFEVAHYEGNSIWFYDLASGRLFTQSGLPRYSYADPSLGHVAWAPTGATSVVGQSGSETGIVISAVDDPSSAAFVRVETGYLNDTALAYEPERVAFTFSSDEYGGDPATGLAVVRRDGRGRETIDTQGVKSPPAFDPTGGLWWLEGGSLLRWNGSETSVAAQIDPSFRWEILSIEQNAIALAGRSEERAKARFVLLDDAGRTVVSHTAETDFTTYLGLA